MSGVFYYFRIPTTMKDFKKLIEELAYRHSIMQVFDDFMHATVCAFSMGRMEDQLEDIMRRYDERERSIFGKALGALVKAYDSLSDSEGGWNDPLGIFFEEYNAKFGRDAMGQFFTPKSLCDLMASLTYVPSTEPRSISDPSCGSGRNLIAYDRMDPMNRMRNTYVGQDLDRRCVMMCTINLVMYGMRGYVIHMNTISMEIFGGYRICLPETGLGVIPLSVEECRSVVTSPSEAVPKEPPAPHVMPPPNPVPPVQLSLFC